VTMCSLLLSWQRKSTGLLAKLTHLFESLSNSHKQTLHCIAYYCLNSLFDHWLQGLLPHHPVAHARLVDEALDSVLRHTLVPGALDDPLTLRRCCACLLVMVVLAFGLVLTLTLTLFCCPELGAANPDAAPTGKMRRPSCPKSKGNLPWLATPAAPAAPRAGPSCPGCPGCPGCPENKPESRASLPRLPRLPRLPWLPREKHFGCIFKTSADCATWLWCAFYMRIIVT
jgi:hypothetical protein